MKNNLLFGLPVVFLLAVVFTPVYAPGHAFVIIDSAEIFENSAHLSAKINVAGDIPIGAQAFGTGVLTDGTLVVSTTHPGVLDSETQANAADPIPHNHYVNLITAENQICLNAGAQFQVDTLSFQSPGIAMWQENMYKIWEVPKASPIGEYTDALTGNQLDFNVGSLTGTPFGDYQVVSFFLFPALPDTVCVIVEQTHTAEPNSLINKVGGDNVQIDTISLLLAAATSTSSLMLAVTISALSIGAYVFTRNPNNVRNVKVILQDYLDRLSKKN